MFNQDFIVDDMQVFFQGRIGFMNITNEDYCDRVF